MEWWAYLLCGLAIWLLGYVSGVGAGRSQALSQMLGLSVLGQRVGPAGMPLGVPGAKP